VAALVTGHGDALGVFLDGAVDDLGHGAVMAQVDDLGARRLQDAPHDVDGRIMAVEKRGGGDNPDVMTGFIGIRFCHDNAVHWCKYKDYGNS